MESWGELKMAAGSAEIKLNIRFLSNFHKLLSIIECVLKYNIKRIGHRVRLRDITVSSYPIIPCNFT